MAGISEATPQWATGGGQVGMNTNMNVPDFNKNANYSAQFQALPRSTNLAGQSPLPAGNMNTGIQNWGASGSMGVPSSPLGLKSSFNNQSLSGFNGLPIDKTVPPPAPQASILNPQAGLGNMNPEMFQKMLMEWIQKGGMK